LQQKINFTEYDVAADRDKARDMIQKSGQMGVPVITVNEAVVIGFNKSRLDLLLGLGTSPPSPPAA
jgi:glutaredoxin 3